MARDMAIVRLQRALDSFDTRYKLGQAHINTDGIYGPVTARQSRWMQWLLGFRVDQIGHWPLETVISWLSHPSLYFARHPGGFQRHRARLAEVRARGPAGYVFPVDGPLDEGRTDRGQDMESQPGAAVRAIGNGVITATPPDSAISSLGQIAGRLDRPWHDLGRVWDIWFAFHLDNCYVNTDQRVSAGQVIAYTSQYPPGAEDMPGHVEYGFALDASGSIDQDVGSDHYASSGQAAHDLFHLLDPSRIHQPAIRAG